MEEHRHCEKCGRIITLERVICDNCIDETKKEKVYKD